MIVSKLSCIVLVSCWISSFGDESNTRKCKPGKVITGVILEAGTKAGEYIPGNDVAKDEDCGHQCCSHPQCDVGFILGSKCFMVICKDYESCKIAQSHDNKMNPRLIFVTRKNQEGVRRSIFSDDQKPPWTPNICPPMVPLKRVTLKGGIHGGEFTDIGPVGGLEHCYDICCQKDDCDLAFMLASNCFTVKCHNQTSQTNDGCVLDPALESPFNPEAAHMLSRINPNKNVETSEKWHDGLSELDQPVMQTSSHLDVTSPTPVITQTNPIPILQNPALFNPLPAPFNPYLFGFDSRPLQQPIITPKPVKKEVIGETPQEIMRGYFSFDPNKLMQSQLPTNPLKSMPESIIDAPIDTQIDSSIDAPIGSPVDIPIDSGCKFDQIYSNTSLKKGKKAGTFIPASENVKNIDSCIWACCSAVNETFRCEVVFWVSGKCYLIDCLDETSCETKAAVSSYSPKIVFVRNILQSTAITSATTTTTTTTTTTQAPTVATTTTTERPPIVDAVKEKRIDKNPISYPEIPNDAKMVTKCGHQEILTDMTLEGASVSGEPLLTRNWASQTAKLLASGVKDMSQCTELCCHDEECDAAVLQDTSCLSVSCTKNPRACMPVSVKSAKQTSQLAFMVRPEALPTQKFGLNNRTIFLTGIGVGAVLLVCVVITMTAIAMKSLGNRKPKMIARKTHRVQKRQTESESRMKTEDEQEQDRLEELLSKVSASFVRNKSRR